MNAPSEGKGGKPEASTEANFQSLQSLVGRDVAAEVESDWMVPLLVEAERRQADGLAAGCEPLVRL